MKGKKQRKLGGGSVSKEVSVESIGSYFHVEGWGERERERLRLQGTERTEVIE